MQLLISVQWKRNIDIDTISWSIIVTEKGGHFEPLNAQRPESTGPQQIDEYADRSMYPDWILHYISDEVPIGHTIHHQPTTMNIRLYHYGPN